MVKDLGISKQGKNESWVVEDEEDEEDEEESSPQSASEDASDSGEEVPSEKHIEPVKPPKKASGQGKLVRS
jgi:hypothetical protein